MIMLNTVQALRERGKPGRLKIAKIQRQANAKRSRKKRDYRVILVVSELGWVDLDLRCSLGMGWWAAMVATTAQAGWCNISK